MRIANRTRRPSRRGDRSLFGKKSVTPAVDRLLSSSSSCWPVTTRSACGCRRRAAARQLDAATGRADPGRAAGSRTARPRPSRAPRRRRRLVDRRVERALFDAPADRRADRPDRRSTTRRRRRSVIVPQRNSSSSDLAGLAPRRAAGRSMRRSAPVGAAPRSAPSGAEACRSPAAFDRARSLRSYAAPRAGGTASGDRCRGCARRGSCCRRPR